MKPTKDVAAAEEADKFVYPDAEITTLHNKLASQLFHLVKKRDGQILKFEREKIVSAIFKAAESVGGSDRSTAERLADEVILYLFATRGSKLPGVEEIQDTIEKVLIERGHARTAKAFIIYRHERAKRRGNGKTKAEADAESKDLTLEPDPTDLAIFVRTSDDDMAQWDKQRMVNAMVREAGVPDGIARTISDEVEEVILDSRVTVITVSLLRELVNAKLIEHGLEDARKRHARLGVPLYDVEKIITSRNRENANIPHNPEATNMTLAESINKQYALLRVFSQDVADAHARGDIHLHDLGFINRPYCSGQSLEYVKKFGLNLPNALSIAKPAKYPETLLAHMVKFSAALQGHFAGAIGWDAVNIFFAPFLVGLSEREMKQIAQMMVFEYSQQSVARGGQAIFSDINIYWEVPSHFENVEAIGPGGVPTGKTYSHFEPEARKFAWALFDVFMEGDGTGRPFFFPKPLVHITDKFFRTPGHEEFLHHISDVAAEKGNTYFVFDRGETAKISECCRLSFKLEKEDLEDAKMPWRMRYCALQNVTLNLPRAGIIAAGDDAKLFATLDDFFDLAIKAHIQKKNFILSLLNLGSEGPLALLTMNKDGEPYLRTKRATYLVGLLGLNELVQAHMGVELHQSEEAFKLGLKVTGYLNLKAKAASEKYGMRFVLEQTPAESAAFRLSRLDLDRFGARAEAVVKGDLAKHHVYYTNSTFLNIAEVMNPIDRVRMEGKFHDLIEAGAITHLWIADSRPSAGSIANFVRKTFKQTRNAQIAFSPEFTACNACDRVTRGLSQTCPHCGSMDVDGITRVTGYFSRISGWNNGKRAELKDRARSGIL
ncbi:MAG: anaerobic ribonucleoside-triphosphate reductase [Candidatus Eisenbacteria bacterium]